MGVCGETSATSVLLITGTVDNDGVVDGSYVTLTLATGSRSSIASAIPNSADGISNQGEHTLAGGVQGTHVENVDALHLSDELQTLETGGLDEVGRDGTGLGTGGEKVILALDLCSIEKRQFVFSCWATAAYA